MKLEEIKTTENVGEVKEIAEGCYKVVASEGHQIKTGDVYTTELYMSDTADVDFAVVTDAEAEEARKAQEAKWKAEMEAQLASTDPNSPQYTDPNAGLSTADEDGEGGTVLTLADRVTRLEARVGALEADAAQAASGDGGEAMTIGEEL